MLRTCRIKDQVLGTECLEGKKVDFLVQSALEHRNPQWWTRKAGGVRDGTLVLQSSFQDLEMVTRTHSLSLVFMYRTMTREFIFPLCVDQTRSCSTHSSVYLTKPLTKELLWIMLYVSTWIEQAWLTTEVIFRLNFDFNHSCSTPALNPHLPYRALF